MPRFEITRDQIAEALEKHYAMEVRIWLVNEDGTFYGAIVDGFVHDDFLEEEGSCKWANICSPSSKKCDESCPQWRKPQQAKR